MIRIYQKFTAEVSDIVLLEKPASHHLMHVLRAKPGDHFFLFNGISGEYEAEIISVDKSLVKAKLHQFVPIDRESPVFIHLAQGIARGEKMDWIIQKAVELGVNKITPLFTEFCNVKLSDDRVLKKLQHWQQIVISAAEQSGRTQLPEITAPQKFFDWVPSVTEDLKILLHPYAMQNNKTFPQTSHAVCLIVGSEGGLSETETEFAMEHNFIDMQLGPRILRTETAGLAAVSILQNLYGDFTV